MKHTPGPWKKGKYSENSLSATIDGEDFTVAFINQDRRNWGANFDLIAAAPELLDAANKALVIARRLHDHTDDSAIKGEICSLYEFLTIAIAKAEGK